MELTRKRFGRLRATVDVEEADVVRILQFAASGGDSPPANDYRRHLHRGWRR